MAEVDEEWVQRAARVGAAARAVLSLLLAVLVVQLAAGDDSQSTDQRGALATLAEQPFGRVLLSLLVVGLVVYAGFRAVQAVKGTETKDRLTSAARVVVYAVLSVLAVSVLRGTDADGGEESITAAVLAAPLGAFVVGLAALGLVGVAAYQVHKGVTRGFAEELDLGLLDPTQRRWSLRLGTAGYVGRGVVFGHVGAFLGRAAVTGDAEDAGLDAALGEVAGAPAGGALLLAVAVGLACHGCYCLVLTRYSGAGTNSG